MQVHILMRVLLIISFCLCADCGFFWQNSKLLSFPKIKALVIKWLLSLGYYEAKDSYLTSDISTISDFLPQSKITQLLCVTDSAIEWKSLNVYSKLHISNSWVKPNPPMIQIFYVIWLVCDIIILSLRRPLRLITALRNLLVSLKQL